MRFQDRGALVTGGGSGIGQQVCFAAAGEGARVAVGDLEAERAEATAAEIRRCKGEAHACQLDVTDPGAVAAAEASLGRWAEPLESANAIRFLADEANGFITGAILTVDGGWTIGKRM